jgi:hypothetical protein
MALIDALDRAGHHPQAITSAFAGAFAEVLRRYASPEEIAAFLHREADKADAQIIQQGMTRQ